ncbi:MAG: urea carboxylase-associated family protein [Rhodospirillaceae bacterium]|nr:urea carboxylase-associated family protein [Rhodospirillaceae bacterium]
MPGESLIVPARKGLAVKIAAGHSFQVVNTHGTQVVDTWAFNAADLSEFMSMEHSRAGFRRLCARIGDSYLSNRRRPILTLADDTSPGRHDTLIAACDPYRYRALGHQGPHDNCTENLADALAALGLKVPETPAPLNLFMNIPWEPNGDLFWNEPMSLPGDAVTLRAEMDVVAVFSTCPMDLLPINGKDGVIREVEIRLA